MGQCSCWKSVDEGCCLQEDGKGNVWGGGAAEAVVDNLEEVIGEGGNGVCRETAKAAYGAVELPEAVIDILVGLRNWLQDKCEPPVYVSDRRFMKAVNLLQVAAHADGRDQVLLPMLPDRCMLIGHADGRDHLLCPCRRIWCSQIWRMPIGHAGGLICCSQSWCMPESATGLP